MRYKNISGCDVEVTEAKRVNEVHLVLNLFAITGGQTTGLSRRYHIAKNETNLVHVGHPAHWHRGEIHCLAARMALSCRIIFAVFKRLLELHVLRTETGAINLNDVRLVVKEQLEYLAIIAACTQRVYHLILCSVVSQPQ